MVLQRDLPIQVWGKAEPREVVSVSIAGRKASANTDAAGRWRVTLEELPAGGPHELSVHGKNAIAIKDVLIGEVWLCSGQSNMEWPMKSTCGVEDLPRASASAMRLFTVKNASAREPRDDLSGAWSPCTPESAEKFSAVAYYFGRDLHERLGVPIGLIQAAWSGAAIESLLPAETLQAHPRFREKFPRWEQFRREYPALLKEYQRQTAEWNKVASEAKAAGKPVPKNPARRPKDPDGPETSLSGLYNAMIHPLVPFGIRGVAFYQAENNLMNPDEYEELFPMLIRHWRKRWNQGDFPFLFVQVANIGPRQVEPGDGLWCRLRDAQRSGLPELSTAMVVAVDVGEAHNIHPRNKRDVGRRLALCARAVAYGEGITYMGPQFVAAEYSGPKVTLHFSHRGTGLKTSDGGPLAGFAIAGEDRQFVWAEAQFDGPRVVLHSPKVAGPIAVRYAWADNPVGNLVGVEGLPACPFRTDRW